MYFDSSWTALWSDWKLSFDWIYFKLNTFEIHFRFIDFTLDLLMCLLSYLFHLQMLPKLSHKLLWVWIFYFLTSNMWSTRLFMTSSSKIGSLVLPMRSKTEPTTSSISSLGWQLIIIHRRILYANSFTWRCIRLCLGHIKWTSIWLSLLPSPSPIWKDQSQSPTIKNSLLFLDRSLFS